jgi:RNA polymerase primary sigma factor
MEFDVQERPEEVQDLLDMAEEQGYIIWDQILEALPDAEENMALVEDLFAHFYERDIKVYENIEEAEMDQVDIDDILEKADDLPESYDISAISPDDAVSLYFKQMSRVPLLTREEEVRLAKQIERGLEAEEQLSQNGHEPNETARLHQQIEQGKQARQHLIKANTRLVVSVAKKYRGRGVPFLDLIQAGNLGLIKAADKFDYRQGTKFSTYATWWIRQSVSRALDKQGRVIRIPVHASERIRKLYGVAQRLEQDLGRRPTPAEIASEVNLEPSKVRWLLKVSGRPLSLERPVGEDGDTELGSFIEDESIPAPTERVEQNLLRENMDALLSTLDPREARILRLRYGLRGERSHTLKELGDKFDLSRERIRQIERRAIRKLRHPRYSRQLRSHLS